MSLPSLGRGRHVWLVGMPGSGKSVVGRALSSELGLAFVDLDDAIEGTAGRSIADMFAEGGEPGFRALESRVLCTVAEGPAAVVATGGGVVLDEANRRLMRRTGTVIHLHVEPDVARQRLAADPSPRPLLADAGSWQRLAGEREPLYADARDALVEPGAGASPGGIARHLTRSDQVLSPLVTTLRVETAGGAHDVVVGVGVLARLRHLLPEPPLDGAAFVIADQDVAGRFLPPLLRALEDAGWRAVHLPVPPGEQAKSLAVAEALYGQLAVHEAQREDLVVALGGGSTGDLAGFVAATYLRGMPVVQVPTTLLAQVDAAIGGKTAVNLPAGKNLVGAFHQPVLVAADVHALTTLPEREYRSGLGEVAKYALVFDRGLPDLLEGRLNLLLRPRVAERGTVEALLDMVTRCVRIKAEVVSKDERDSAERLFLNYGHTLGHALERVDGFRGRTHGEAVAIGMVFAARLAERLGVARHGLVDGHVRLLESLGLPAGGRLPPSAEVLQAMRMDKKRRGALRFVLLEDVGRPTVADVSDEAIVETLEAM